MRNKMDDKYAKEHKKQKSQFHEHLEKKWEPRSKDYKDAWHNEQIKNIKKPKPKPDPATVEAALRLEEELWAS
jgi:hypothetical protein